MRKLKLQMQMSVDGFVGGPNGELEWMTWNWSDDIKKYVTDLTNSFDTIVMGRKMADGFVTHWTNVLNDSSSDGENKEAAKKFVETPKVVFSRTLSKSNWENTTVEKDLVAGISNLKNASGSGIIAYGGANFVSSLIQNGLVDELHLFLNPVAIGKGLSIFSADKTHNLKLVKAIPFECGIVLHHYEPAKS